MKGNEENKIIVKLKHIREADKATDHTPIYATEGAAGADLFASMDQELLLEPGARAKLPTGIALEMPDPSYVGLIFARSGLSARHGLCLSNGVGVVDWDYRGEIKVLISNHGDEEVLIKNGDRIAQILFINVTKAQFLHVQELSDTQRGTGGFGSTDKEQGL